MPCQHRCDPEREGNIPRQHGNIGILGVSEKTGNRLIEGVLIRKHPLIKHDFAHPHILPLPQIFGKKIFGFPCDAVCVIACSGDDGNHRAAVSGLPCRLRVCHLDGNPRAGFFKRMAEGNTDFRLRGLPQNINAIARDPDVIGKTDHRNPEPRRLDNLPRGGGEKRAENNIGLAVAQHFGNGFGIRRRINKHHIHFRWREGEKREFRAGMNIPRRFRRLALLRQQQGDAESPPLLARIRVAAQDRITGLACGILALPRQQTENRRQRIFGQHGGGVGRRGIAPGIILRVSGRNRERNHHRRQHRHESAGRRKRTAQHIAHRCFHQWRGIFPNHWCIIIMAQALHPHLLNKEAFMAITKKSPAAKTGGLTITATPIGNLGDLSPRARAALEAADIIACEDTRHTGLMLKRLGIARRRLIAYHDHSKPATAQKLLAAMRAGENVSLVSDAGTPLVCDPGFRLVQLCHDNAIPVTAIPGPSALLAGLVVSGIASDGFFFGGFLPPRETARRKKLTQYLRFDTTVILYESPRRIAASLRLIAELAPTRRLAVAREMTKLHEEIHRGTADEILSNLAGDTGKTRGEITLIIAGDDQTATAKDSITDSALQALLEKSLAAGMSRRDAAAAIANEAGVSRKRVYAIASSMKPDKARK